MTRKTPPRETLLQNRSSENDESNFSPDSFGDAQATMGNSGKRALTERGRNAVARILKCATDMFITEGYGGLTMRKVASAAGIALSNLQHYFPSIEPLFAALMRQVIDEYAKTYDNLRHDLSLTAEQRLEKVIRLLIEDDKQSRTQSLFINMWAMAQTHDFAREIVDEAYLHQRRWIRGFLEAVNPDLSSLELSCRAALITCQIEGLMILIPQRNRFPSDIKGIEEEAVRSMMSLALAESARQPSPKPRARDRRADIS